MICALSLGDTEYEVLKTRHRVTQELKGGEIHPAWGVRGSFTEGGTSELRPRR